MDNESKIDVSSLRRPRLPQIILIAAALVIGALGARYLIWPPDGPCPPCPPCPPAPTVVITAPAGGPTAPVTKLVMQSTGLGMIDVQVPTGATIMLSGGPASDMIKVNGASMPSPARVPAGTFTIGVETTAPGIRVIEITANM